jgi:hypothetical protein
MPGKSLRLDTLRACIAKRACMISASIREYNDAAKKISRAAFFPDWVSNAPEIFRTCRTNRAQRVHP